jgi:hypothetical protein
VNLGPTSQKTTQAARIQSLRLFYLIETPKEETQQALVGLTRAWKGVKKGLAAAAI